MEHELAAAAADGRALDLSDRGPDDRALPAETVRAVLSRGDGGRSLTLIGARIEGVLDLEAVELGMPLVLHRCELTEALNLDHARVELITLSSCRLPALSAEQLVTRGNFELTDTTTGIVNLVGARIGGQLVLSGATLSGGSYPPLPEGTALRPRDERVESVSGIALTGDGMEIDGSLVCDAGFRATGQVRLVKARVRGAVLFDGAILQHGGDEALFAEDLDVGGSMWCWNGFRAEGELCLRGAKVGGMLVLDGAQLHNESGAAFNGELLDVGGSLLCRGGFKASGGIALNGAHIGGDALFDTASITVAAGIALHGDRLRVDGSVSLGRGFTAEGELRLVYARIGGAIECPGARLRNPTGRALFAQGAEIGRAALLHGLEATGEVRLSSARIGGSLELDGATLENPGAQALVAENFEVRESLFGRSANGRPLTVTGEIDLAGAHIGGAIELQQARLRNPDAISLQADRLAVDGNAFLSGVEATGEIRLGAARIGGQLSLNGATLVATEGRSLIAERLTVGDSAYVGFGVVATGAIDLSGGRFAGALIFTDATLAALDLSESEVGGRLELRFAGAPPGIVDLTGARLRELQDSPHVWPAGLRLRRCRYDDLRSDPDLSVRQRLRWLERDPEGFVPEPYEQLIAHYRQHGREVDARRVAIARERRRRTVLPLPSKAWNAFLGATVGFGYAPWRAGVWLLGLLALGTLVFAGAHPEDIVRASTSGNVDEFQPLIYTLDLMVPVVNLRQRTAWVPEGAAQWWAFGFTLSGWVLTTAVVAGVTGVLKRS